MSLQQPGDALNGANAPHSPASTGTPATAEQPASSFVQPVIATPPTFASAISGSNGTMPNFPQFSAATAELLARAKANVAATQAGTPGYEAAREQLLKSMVTSDKLLPIPAASSAPKRGRGRGRGRGGGDARSPELGANSTPGSASTPVSERGRGRVGRPRGRGRGGGRGGKRKRSESVDSDAWKDPSPESETDFKPHQDADSDISDSYTPLPAKTKSGRSVNKPVQFVPTIPEPTRETKKRRPYRRNIEAAVCKMCHRGTSPSANQIVFCDGCGTPYHQYCHDPPIEKDVVDIPDKEWSCIECVKSRENTAAASAEGFIPGDNLSAEEKRNRLSKLPQSRLIDLLIQASSIHPTLAVFPSTSTNPPHQSTTTTSNTIAKSSFPGDTTAGAEPEDQTAQADPYDGYDTDPPAHYPKPGNGVARTLRPESEDLQWLVDDNFEVFSHQTNYPSTGGGVAPAATNGTSTVAMASSNVLGPATVAGAFEIGDVSMSGS